MAMSVGKPQGRIFPVGSKLQISDFESQMNEKWTVVGKLSYAFVMVVLNTGP